MVKVPYNIPHDAKLTPENIKPPMVIENYYTGQRRAIMAQYAPETYKDGMSQYIMSKSTDETVGALRMPSLIMTMTELRGSWVKMESTKEELKLPEGVNPYAGSGKYKGD